MRVGPILAIAAVAATLSALWWLETLRETERAETADPGAVHAPEAYFDRFVARGWQNDGGPRHALRGERMERYSDDESSLVTAPRLHYRPRAQPPWYAASDTGRIDGSGDRVELIDRVAALRNPMPPNPLVMRTARLRVSLADGRAETDDRVHVVSAGTRVHSIGMTARFDDGRIDLHDDVRARHERARTEQ